MRALRHLVVTALALLLGCKSPPGNPETTACNTQEKPGNPAGVTVTGRVVDGFHRGMAGVTVVIDGRSTTSDGNGEFTVSGVTTPYDAVVVQPPYALVYAGLIRTDPELGAPLALGPSPHPHPDPYYGSLTGAIIGGDPFPTTSDTHSVVSWGSPAVVASTEVVGSPYELNLFWHTPSTATGSLHGLQWTTDGLGTVTGYHSYGVTNVITVDGAGGRTTADLTLSPFTSQSIGNLSVNITPPAGHVITRRSVYLSFADGAAFGVSDETYGPFADAAFSFPVPSDIGATATLSVTTVDADAGSSSQQDFAGLQPGEGPVAVTMAAPATLITPLDGAIGVDTSTEFVWTPIPDGNYALSLSPVDPTSDDPVFTILTGGTQTRIPDLCAEGLALPSRRDYDVLLGATGPSIGTFTQSRFTTR